MACRMLRVCSFSTRPLEILLHFQIFPYLFSNVPQKLLLTPLALSLHSMHQHLQKPKSLGDFQPLRIDLKRFYMVVDK